MATDRAPDAARDAPPANPRAHPLARPPLRRSFALRAALLAAAAVLLASLLGSGWVWLSARAALRDQLDLAVAAEASGLLREYRQGGAAGLAAVVAAQARRQGPFAAALFAPDGRPLAGAVPGASPGLTGFANLPGTGDGPRLRALGGSLPGGLRLVVAAERESAERAAAALARTPPLAGATTAALALALGYLAARRLERRLRAVRRAAQAVMAGDLARRLPVSPGGDEFDRLSATVNAMLARVEALVTGLRQVTDDVAHDLRGPLSRLRQRLEAAQARARDPAADQEVLEGALTELDAVLATFAALLRIAQAEAGTPRAGFAPVDLSALVQGMADAYAPAAEDAGRRLLAEVAPGVRVNGDAALLRQAVANLLDNALLHGGTALRLRLRDGRDGDPARGVNGGLGGGPAIEVEDDGPGIPAGERARVLRRFVRLDRSRGTPGTGLGLALVAAVAGLHGGDLTLSDAPSGAGPGLRVTFAFSPTWDTGGSGAG